jgi:hypothetical protein
MTKARDSSLIQNVHTGSGAHLILYEMCPGVSFAGGKSAVCPVMRWRMSRAVPLPSPYSFMAYTETTLRRVLKPLCNVVLYKVLRDYESTYSHGCYFALSSVAAVAHVA